MRPQKIESIHLGKHSIDERIIQNTTVYLVAYVFILVVSFLIVSTNGFTTTTNFTAVLSCLNNIGPGLEMVGPTHNYSGYNVISKIVLIFDMLAGRLEIFPILVLFSAFSRKVKWS